MYLNELIVQRSICYRCEVKDRVESGSCRITELFWPIQRRQIFRYEITAIAGEILEVARAKIVNDREARVGKSFL